MLIKDFQLNPFKASRCYVIRCLKLMQVSRVLLVAKNCKVL